MKTWQMEMAAAAIVLVFVTLVAGAQAIEFVGAGAVFLSFAHMQVADRLAESEASRSRLNHDLGLIRMHPNDERFLNDFNKRRDAHGVHCHAWATRYLVSKECLWVVYFVVHGSYSALAGVGLFLAYPMWRRLYRRA